MTFEDTYQEIARELLLAPSVDVGKWHNMDVSGKPELVIRELMNWVFEWDIPTASKGLLQLHIKPHLPFAEAQFLDRVSGEPLNPPPSAALWPWAHTHATDPVGKYSHTYPERFWPKQAGKGEDWPESDNYH